VTTEGPVATPKGGGLPAPPRGGAGVEVAIALDVPSLDQAVELVDRLGPRATLYKVGLQLYSKFGTRAVEMLREHGKKVFLDLKLHDIPNTVAGAVTAAAEGGAHLLTVHVSGGRRMMEAAAHARDAAGGADLRVVGVTVLTSLSRAELEEVRGGPVPEIEDEVVRLASLAVESGLDGVVSSVLEVTAIRRALGPEPFVVTPGIRLSGGASHDQARIAGPAEAVRRGSNCLVVGRAVTAAPDPAVALDAVLAELEAAELERGD
jgi:orotidine-5'-phosphate decarboxylase